MVGEVAVEVCLVELRDSTEPGAARERRVALLGTAGVASGGGRRASGPGTRMEME